MSFAYTRFKQDLGRGLVNFQEAGADIRVALVGTSTTADTEQDTALMNAFTTLDEHTGGGYVRKTVDTQVFNEDLANNRGEFDGLDITWTALNSTGTTSGTNDVAGILVYRHVTNDTDSVPIAYIDTGGLPKATNGGDFTITWNAEGILQVT